MGGGGVMGGGGEQGDYIYLSLLHCTTRMTCIMMGSDESHFYVSVTVRDKDTRQCPRTTTFEQKVEPKRNLTDILLTSLTLYR